MWDWAAARILANMRYGFGAVVPVPSKNRPGTRDNAAELAIRLGAHVEPGKGLLVVDDVWTTGRSVIKTIQAQGAWADEYGEPYVAVQVWTVFARAKMPFWADALWHYGGADE